MAYIYSFSKVSGIFVRYLQSESLVMFCLYAKNRQNQRLLNAVETTGPYCLIEVAPTKHYLLN